MTAKKTNKRTPSAIYSVDDRISVWEDYGRLCHYCDKVLPKPGTKAGKGTHFDHIVPESKGGSHCLSNLVVCCKRCNTEKSDKDYATFLDDRITQAKKQIRRLAQLQNKYKRRLKNGIA